MTKPRVTPNNAFKPSYRAQGEAITPEPVQDKGVGTQPPVSEVQ